MARAAFYPEIEPYESGMLAVGGPHTLYWEQSGKADGVAVVFLHGGPGAGSTPTHRRFFDPAHYRIVVFDQRGAGRSTPAAGIADNTTAHLVADIEALREHLGIARWIVFGGSWGSTLALAYAEAHPGRCLALALRGIFLCRAREIDWFLNGMGTIFPEHWRAFAEALPEDERGALLANYHRRLTDPDPAVHLPAAHAWAVYEACCTTLKPNPESAAAFDSDAAALALARIEAHYFINHSFMAANALLDNIDSLRAIPAVIVQGRYDIVCPPVTADELARAWPEADYRVVDDAGHSAMEPGIRAELVGAMERFKAIARDAGGGDGA